MRTLVIAIASLLVSETSALGIELCAKDVFSADCYYSYSEHVIGFSSAGDGCGLADCPAGTDVLSISSSPTDPFANSGPLVGDKLYLWVACSTGYGFQYSFLDFSGDHEVIDYEPFVGRAVLNDPDPLAQDLFIHLLPCSRAPTLLGEMTISPTVAVHDLSWGAAKSRYR